MINSNSDIKISYNAKLYIESYTKRCSTELVGAVSKDGNPIYCPWISPDDAGTSCMIEREEVINQFKELIESKIKEWHYADSCEAKYRREMLRDLLKEIKKEE